MTSKIILNNKQVCLVSETHYLELNKYKWYNYNYVSTTIDYKNTLIHRYIILKILKMNIPEGYVVDHINNNKLDNRIENLRLLSYSENSRNKEKKNTTSLYYGVSKSNNKWRVSIRIESDRKIRYYNDELHAAWQYNLWIKEFNCKGGKFNSIECPRDFTESISSKELPKGITLLYNKYRARFTVDKHEYHIGYYLELKDAVEALNNFKLSKKTHKEKTNIIRNELNQCILKVKDKEIIVDEEKYEELSNIKWNIYKDYANGEINNKKVLMHRYIIDYFDKKIVDHINGNPLDNRISNLRIVTHKQNSMNKMSAKNSSSEYIGVSYNKKNNKWIARIKVDDKTLFLGSFKEETDAAKVRDIATIKYYKEYGKLNFDK